MQRGTLIALAVALFIAGLLVVDPMDLGISDYLGNYGLDSTLAFGHVLSGSVPFLLRTSRTSEEHFSQIKGIQSKHKPGRTGSKLSVFKGRKASLNRAIFVILDKEGPKTVIEIQKQLSKQKNLEGTYYASVNKRIHCLEKAGYIKPALNKTAQPTSKAIIYELRAKAYLATFINKKSAEELLNKVTDKDATIILSDLVHAFLTSNREQEI